MPRREQKAPSEPKQKEIERQEDDPFRAHARVQQETSNDGKFSTYERVKVPGGELILQYRGAPKD